MKFEYKSLDEIGRIKRGRSKHRPRNDASLFGGKYPFIQTAEIKRANLYITEYDNTYNDKGLEQSKLWDEDTLCITIAANIADTAILKIKACFPDSVMGFIPNKDTNVKYIKYCFNILQKQCQQISQGTAQDNLCWEKLSTIKFPIPSKKEQDKITDILSSYDDLIENNQKQIKLLEEAAQRLYKEWFVDLHFPGYEHTKIIDGIPQDWEKKEIGSLIKGVPRTKKIKTAEILKEGLIPVIDQSRDFIAGYTNDADSIINSEVPIIVFGDHTRIVKFIQFSFARGADGTQLIISSNDNVSQYLLHCSILNVDLSNYHYARHFKYLKSEKILLPSKEININFTNIVKPIYEKIHNARKIISQAQEARDLLLPKLMSGKIEV